MLDDIWRDNVQILVEQFLLLWQVFANVVGLQLRQFVRIADPSHLHKAKAGLDSITECLLQVRANQFLEFIEHFMRKGQIGGHA